MRSMVEGASLRTLVRSMLLAAALTATTALAACSGLTPVYGERGIGVERHAFRYDKPASRLDQIIYQELVLKLGRATDPSVPLVRITTTSSVRGLTKTNVANPAAQKEAVVTARIELIDADGTIAYTATRSAAASFTTDRYQALAETEAEKEARERAARELAETVRLTLLGALANPA
jgi:LPS-assembly lipoprotein